nr:RNA-directed DNA polymerase [Arthrobacter sp. zg-Y916]
MPKKGLGPRPISLLSPETRTLYEALVERLKPRLPTPSRSGSIEAHHLFGTTGPQNDSIRIVDFDIAACYEYVDHRILSEELVIQTLDAETVSVLKDLLLEMFPRGVGIPQAMEPSHLLADSYLDQVERNIVRDGYEVHRYADDFRIIAPSWGEAHEAIERAVDVTRQRGLVLADGKTRIRSVRQILEEIQEQEKILQQYRNKAADELGSIDYVQVGYEDFEEILLEPDPDQVDFAALAQVVEDWVSGDPEQRSVHAQFGARALQVLQAAPERISDEWLVRIAEREPIRLLNIVRYLAGRPETEENWSSLSKLTKLPRKSPWARLWMMHLGDQLEKKGWPGEAEFLEWSRTLLTDRYETVRAEAAWLLAGHKNISFEELADLFVASTDVTRIGIAASAGRMDVGKENRMAKALKSDSVLSRAAYEWGRVYAG